MFFYLKKYELIIYKFLRWENKIACMYLFDKISKLIFLITYLISNTDIHYNDGVTVDFET